MDFVARLVRDRSGTTAIEYSLIIVLVGVVLVIAGPFLRDALNAMYDIVSAAVVDATAGD